MMIAIGVVIGFVMGLTGAGGALVSIPLFMHFLNMPLKEASVFSLIAVVIASLSNFYFQRKNANLRLAGIFVLASTLGSYLSRPYKNVLPEIGIATLLALIALYSLYSVWFPRKKTTSSTQSKPHYLSTILIGLTLGVLTTFTGLGGGVLMLPVLLGIYKLPQKEAVATSLVVVGLSSLSSFLIQASQGMGLNLEMSFLGLVGGILVTSYGLKFLTARMSARSNDWLGKFVFTLVVIFSMTKIF